MDYLRMNLDLSPNEYMATSRYEFETALKYQNARSGGIEKARKEHQEQKDFEKWARESQDELRKQIGG